jgi:diaminopimelate decarboxylase
MDSFHYHERALHCEEVPVATVATAYGTPVFVYSQRAILEKLAELREAFHSVRPLICYSIKTNGNVRICQTLAEAGAGFDVTSGGELDRAIRAGGSGKQIVFAGVGKTMEELRQGLATDVLMFNVESEAEFAALSEVAQSMGKIAWAALRVNPDLPPKTHVKTDTSVKGAKFGFDIVGVIDFAKTVVGNAGVRIVGLHMHLGSPILETKPYRDALVKARGLISQLRAMGHRIEYLNMGGGFGIDYRGHEALPARAFAEVIVPAAQELDCRLILEPGRFIIGNAGILVSRVIYTKVSGGRRFIIQDAGMNDLIRPTLYEAFHRIWPVAPGPSTVAVPDNCEDDVPGATRQDVVGPVCESGDFLAKNRPLPLVRPGDLLATFSAGAYGMAMSSNYNGRPRAAEVLVNGSSHRLIRRRETYDDLVRTEIDL